MTWEELEKQVLEVLPRFGFHQDGEVWKLEKKFPDQHMQVSINGKSQTVVQPGLQLTCLVRYNEAQVGGEERIQTAFELQESGLVRREYEELFENINDFCSTLVNFFNA